MTTTNQQSASRANGAKSIGPVTVDGKARVSQNAIKHGLLAKVIVLRWESQELFDSFFQSYLERYAPANDSEYLLLEEIVASKWRLRRLWACENRLLSFETDRMEADLNDKFENMDIATRVALAYKENCDNSRAMANLQRHEARLSREARLADKQLRELQSVRNAGEMAPETVIDEKSRNKPEPAPARSQSPKLAIVSFPDPDSRQPSTVDATPETAELRPDPNVHDHIR